MGACLLPLASPRPLAGVSFPFPCPSLALALSLPGVVVVGIGGGGLWGADGPCLVVGGLQPPAEGFGVFGGRRPWSASRRRAYHAACGMAASGAVSLGFARVPVPIFSKVCTMCTPSRLPAPPAHFMQRWSSRKAVADHQARWEGAWGGGEGSELKVLERRWRGLGVEDAYGRRGERKLGVVCQEGDMNEGRRWWAWRRPGERERRWRGLGLEDAFGQRVEREPRGCSWGEGDAFMGRRWRAWRRPGERERQEQGHGGSWRRLGERKRRE